MSVLAHVGGFPLEETLGSAGPALLVAFGVAWVNLRDRVRRVRSRAGAGGRTASAAIATLALELARQRRVSRQDTSCPRRAQ